MRPHPEVTISCGVIRYIGNGQYYAKVDFPRNEETSINVSYTLIGKKVTVEKQFRNKRVHYPVIKRARLKYGKINKNILLAQIGITSKMEISISTFVSWSVLFQ